MQSGSSETLIGWKSVAEFTGIGLSHRPARLPGLAGRYDNLMPKLTLSPSQGSMNSGTEAVRHEWEISNAVSDVLNKFGR